MKFEIIVMDGKKKEQLNRTHFFFLKEKSNADSRTSATFLRISEKGDDGSWRRVCVHSGDLPPPHAEEEPKRDLQEQGYPGEEEPDLLPQDVPPLLVPPEAGRTPAVSVRRMRGALPVVWWRREVVDLGLCGGGRRRRGLGRGRQRR